MTPSNQVKQSLDGEYVYIREWNPLLLAVFYGHLHIVKYFCEVLKVHLRITLAMSKGGEYALLFSLAVALANPKNTDIFKYLWDKYEFIWDFKCFKQALLMIISHERKDLLVFL